ncbi:hypothetical protein GCM10027048_40960 [Hymenobacter coalescens]
MRLRNGLLVLAAVSLLPACKSFDPRLLEPTPGVLTPRLPTATPAAQTDWIIQLGAPGLGAAGPRGGSRDVNTLFEREVRETLTDPYGTPSCYLVLTTTIVDKGSGWGWTVLSVATNGGLNLLGLPYSRTRMTVDVKLDVLDRQRRLVGSYRGQGQAKALGSLFSKTNYISPGRVVYVQAVRAGLQQVKTSLQADMARLQAGLAAAPR